ncbi:hypothetical protein [Euzebya tangerina]|uniref:hypothetical protein n=1 Tax=Euzebya tangerina TaxID=591198 RepID=UPI000E3185F9|nr:hypothetical protein [Euzebya tangerina]
MSAADRAIAAPQLRETADIHWDSGHDPVIRWDASGRRFWLVDGADSGRRLLLWAVGEGTDSKLPEAETIAEVFRDGLAACDFPPDGSGVPEHRASATLRVAGLSG